MFTKILSTILKHKFMAGLVVLGLILGSYFMFNGNGSTETRYVVAAVEKGTIVASITGSGQVSVSNQVDIKPKASGDIVYVGVKNGQEVRAGTLIAQIDAGNAPYELETAKLSYEKLTTVDPDELRDLQNTLTKAEEDLADAYITARASLTSASTDMADVLAGVDELFNGYLSTVNRFDISNTSKDYLERAEEGFHDADDLLLGLVKKYRTVSATTSDSEIEAIISESYEVSIAVSQAAKYAQDATVYLREHEDNNNQTTADEAYASVTSMVSTANAVVSNLSSAKSSIVNGKRTVENARIALEELEDGPDTLNLRAEELALRQKQKAYADYFVHAPFAGVIASLEAEKGQNVGSGTVIATLITKQKIAELSLNEVDAAKVSVGDKATLTFDAIEDLSLTGEVAEIDAIGTVTQGVVSYKIKIGFDSQDERVKTGMTANASIQTDVRQDVLAIPSSAVKTQNGISYVQVFNPALSSTNGTQGVVSNTPPQQVEVTVGISDDINVEILSGLEEGQQIVTRTVTGSATTNTTPANNARGSGGFGAPAIRF